MSPLAVLALAMMLDALLGEPKWVWNRLPHPTILMGKAVDWLDHRLNTGVGPRIRGVAAMALLAMGAIFVGVLIEGLGWLPTLLVTAVLLAQRSLMDHVGAVADALRLSVGDARLAVANIVGRDTAAMDGPAISRAAIESAAENFSDGVVAPVFWFLVAGLPGLLLYKITNTADSMIGYRTPRHLRFGWAAARFDDVLNLIPARLTAILIAAPYGQLAKWAEISKDAGLHRSPNAGWPEAALARVLNVALAGPRSYDDEMRDFPYVNPDGQGDIGAAQVAASCTALWRIWAVMLGVIIVVAVVTG